MNNPCRVCAEDNINDTNTIVNLFEQTGKSKRILNRLAKITGIELKKRKDMPQWICNTCQLQLTEAFNFRIRCKRAQSKLRAAIKKPSIIANDATSEHPDCRETYTNFDSPFNTTEDHIHADQHSLVKIETDELLQNEKDESPIEIVETFKNSKYESDNDETPNMEQYYFTCDVLCKSSSSSSATPEPDDNEEDFDEKNCLKVKAKNIPESTEERRPKKRGRKKKSESESCTKANSSNCISAKFICELCGQSYSAKHYLLAHMNMHKGENPYVCNICPEKFHSQRNLKRHLMKHAGTKPYACRFCDKRFLDFYARMRHERVHNNERPCKCSYCDKAFTTNYILKNHLLTHTGERPFSCKICQRSFSQKKHLTSHFKSTVHKDNEEKAKALQAEPV